MKKQVIAAVTSVGLLVGCATDDPNKGTKIGAAVGAVIGGVLGHQVNDDNGRYVGALVGLAAGAGVGVYMDKQQRELEQRLSEEQRNEQLKITRLPDGSLQVGVASEASFDTNSSTIKPEFIGTYQKIAAVLEDFDQTVVHVIGHTDSIGTYEYNQALSERRANSVATLLTNNGASNERLRVEGRGEREPVASNVMEDGRRKNRRVDIVIKPLVKGREEEAYQPPAFVGETP